MYFLGCQIALATGFLSLFAFGSKCLASVWEAETNAWLSKAMAAGITVPYDTLGLQTADLINNQWPLRSGILLKEVSDFKVFQPFLDLQGLQVTSRYRFRQCFLILLLCGIGHLLSCDDSAQFQFGEYMVQHGPMTVRKTWVHFRNELDFTCLSPSRWTSSEGILSHIHGIRSSCPMWLWCNTGMDGQAVGTISSLLHYTLLFSILSKFSSSWKQLIK